MHLRLHAPPALCRKPCSSHFVSATRASAASWLPAEGLLYLQDGLCVPALCTLTPALLHFLASPSFLFLFRSQPLFLSSPLRQ